MHHRPLSLVVAGSTVLLLAATGCSSTKKHPVSAAAPSAHPTSAGTAPPPSAASLIAQARQYFHHSSYHMTGTTTVDDEGKFIAEVVGVADPTGGAARIDFTLQRGGMGSIVFIKKEQYAKGDAKFFEALGESAADATRVANELGSRGWLSTPLGKDDGSAQTLNDGYLPDSAGTEGTVQTASGVAVIPLMQASDFELDVQATGKHYPVLISSPSDGTKLVLSRWDEPVTIDVPDVKDLFVPTDH
jgi:hypothetical protein